MWHVLAIVTIRSGRGTEINIHSSCQYPCASDLIQVEAHKYEQCSYVKTAVLCGQNACKCHAELCEALGDHALP
jgi:hypothetical protein